MFENPYGFSSSPQQNGISYYQNYNTQPLYNAPRQPQNVSLNGRIVTSIEEARASQIALDGSQWFFPSPAENKIYTKSIGMNGMPIFLTYELQKELTCVNSEPDINSLVKRIERLEEVLNNGHDATNANGINATTNQ